MEQAGQSEELPSASLLHCRLARKASATLELLSPVAEEVRNSQNFFPFPYLLEEDPFLEADLLDNGGLGCWDDCFPTEDD